MLAVGRQDRKAGRRDNLARGNRLPGEQKRARLREGGDLDRLEVLTVWVERDRRNRAEHGGAEGQRVILSRRERAVEDSRAAFGVDGDAHRGCGVGVKLPVEAETLEAVAPGVSRGRLVGEVGRGGQRDDVAGAYRIAGQRERAVLRQGGDDD